MLKNLTTLTNSVGFGRKLSFVAPRIPDSTPNKWEIVREFVSKDQPQLTATPETLKTLCENIAYFEEDFFECDEQLQKELDSLSSVFGISLNEILISEKVYCQLCGSPLRVKADRPSRVVLYSTDRGTIVGSHYHKICKRGSCNLVQHYGYYSKGSKSIHLDYDWKEHKWLLSTRETGFDMKFLHNFDAELLIGQVSYHQKADIYNYQNEYNTTCKAQYKTNVSDVPKKGNSRLVSLVYVVTIQEF